MGLRYAAMCKMTSFHDNQLTVAKMEKHHNNKIKKISEKTEGGF